jgi:hypothetical protein
VRIDDERAPRRDDENGNNPVADEIVLEEGLGADDEIGDDIVLDEGLAEALEPSPDDIVLDSDPEIETPFTKVEGVEVVDESLLRFFSELTDEVSEIDLEDEGTVTLDEGVQEYTMREGAETPPLDTLVKLIDFTERRLSFLDKTLLVSNIRDDNSKELFEFVKNSKPAEFLDTRDLATLISLIHDLESEEEVINSFLKHKKISKMQMFDLVSYIGQMMAKYRSFEEKNEVISNIRSNISRYVLNQFIMDIREHKEIMITYGKEQRVCYVKKISVAKEHNTFTCGNCDSEGKNGRFFKAIVSDRAYDSEVLTLFPLGAVCLSCDHLNILTLAEHKLMSSKFNRNYETYVDYWRKDLVRTFGSLVAYEFKPEYLVQEKPNLYELINEYVEDEKEEVGKDYSILNKWYEETESYLKLLNATFIRNTGGVKMINGEISHDEKDLRASIAEITKLYCNLFRENYTLTKNNAVMSFLAYLQDNPILMNSLSPEVVWKKQALLAHKGYLNSGLSDEELDYVYSMICKELGIEYKSFIEGDGVNSFSKQLYELEMTDKFKELEESLVRSKESVRGALTNLRKSEQLFKFIEVRNVPNLNLERFHSILVEDDVYDWVDHVTNLMILNKLTDKILDYWGTLKVGDVRHKSYVNPNSKKDPKELASLLIEGYSKEFRGRGLTSSPVHYLNDFLSSDYIKKELVTQLYSLTNSLETLDYFKFSETVVDLCSSFNLTSRAFKPFLDFLSEYENEALGFTAKINKNTTGNKLLDYYHYHYGHLFSLQEITDSLKELQGYNKPSFYIEREEGKTFGQYIRKLNSMTYDEETCIIDKDLSKFHKSTKYLPVVYSTTEFLRYISGIKKNINTFLMMGDLLYYSYFFGKKFMYEVLGIRRLFVDETKVIDSVVGPIPGFDDQKYSYLLDNLYYVSKRFNAIASGDEEDTLDLAEALMEDTSVFLEQMKFFGELGEDIYQHYTDRGNDSDPGIYRQD